MFADDIVLCMENPIDSAKKLLHVASDSGATEAHKVNTEIPKVFLAHQE